MVLRYFSTFEKEGRQKLLQVSLATYFLYFFALAIRVLDKLQGQVRTKKKIKKTEKAVSFIDCAMNEKMNATLRKVVIGGVACQLPSSKEVQSPNYCSLVSN